MGDYERDRQAGAEGRGWNADTNMAAYHSGQEDARRAAAEQRTYSHVSRSTTTEGAGGGLIVLLGLVVGGVLLYTLRLYILSLACAIVVAGAGLWIALLLLRKRPDWWRPFSAVAQAYGLAILIAVSATMAAVPFARAGFDLTPGLEIFPADGGTPRITGIASIALPALAGLAVATFWLNRSLPATGFPRALRWIALALTLVGSLPIGVRLARMILRLF